MKLINRVNDTYQFYIAHNFTSNGKVVMKKRLFYYIYI
jgi:hypothetical protein